MRSAMRVQQSERRKIDDTARWKNDRSGWMERPLRRMLATRPTTPHAPTGGSQAGTESPRVIRWLGEMRWMRCAVSFPSWR